MIYPIVLYGSPVLKKVAAPIDSSYPELSQLIDDMFKTMYKADGVGLAAPQIGLSIRVFVVDVSALGKEMPECAGFKKVFINPEILSSEGDLVAREEGCLSLPGISETVRRPESITIRYFDGQWNEHVETIHGFAARAVQHEYDHIDGHVFVDKISLIRKQMIASKLSALSKGKVTCRYKTRS
ncbi:MAG: peptide deformylase [Paludibacteraceae bacterium]|nr:peptide deformylase [Paludibacteraceae bacterium]